MLLETDRTIMRKLIAEDALDFYTLNLDEEVIKYTGDQSFRCIQDAEVFLAGYDQYVKYGVGRLAVIEKSTTCFLGWCGLKYSPDIDEYDIGFRFFKQYWNRGFATETANKCLEYGFNVLHLEKITGRAMKDNIASIRVLEKIGMSYKRTFDFNGSKGVIYEKVNINS